MVPLGISGAAATRVGNAIGARNPDGARAPPGLPLPGAGVMTVSADSFATFPRELLARSTRPEDYVVEVAMVLLPIAALFQVFDGLQVVAAGVLRGAADTRVPAVLAVAAIGVWASRWAGGSGCVSTGVRGDSGGG